MLPNDFSRCRLLSKAACAIQIVARLTAVLPSLPPQPPKKSSRTDLRHCEQTSVSSAVATGHRRIHKIPSNGISFHFQRGNVMSNRIEKKEVEGKKKEKAEKRNCSRWGSCQGGKKKGSLASF